eukprot:31383-Pelagococcus_subviridis.AAC.20
MVAVELFREAAGLERAERVEELLDVALRRLESDVADDNLRRAEAFRNLRVAAVAAVAAARAAGAHLDLQRPSLECFPLHRATNRPRGPGGVELDEPEPAAQCRAAGAALRRHRGREDPAAGGGGGAQEVRPERRVRVSRRPRPRRRRRRRRRPRRRRRRRRRRAPPPSASSRVPPRGRPSARRP